MEGHRENNIYKSLTTPQELMYASVIQKFQQLVGYNVEDLNQRGKFIR
jgi:hypothetical protein